MEKTKKLLRPKSAKLVLKLIKTNNDNVLTEIEMLNYCIALPNSHPKPQNNDDFSSTTIVPITGLMQPGFVGRCFHSTDVTT